MCRWNVQCQERNPFFSAFSSAAGDHCWIRASVSLTSYSACASSLACHYLSFTSACSGISHRPQPELCYRFADVCSLTSYSSWLSSQTYLRYHRFPNPYSCPQIPDRGQRQRGSLRSNMTVVATTWKRQFEKSWVIKAQKSGGKKGCRTQLTCHIVEKLSRNSPQKPKTKGNSLWISHVTV